MTAATRYRFPNVGKGSNKCALKLEASPAEGEKGLR